MKKRWVNILIYAGVLLGVTVIAGIADGRLSDRPCEGIKPVIRNNHGNEFLDGKKVRELIREEHGAMIEDEAMGEINVADIELALRENHYIRDVEVYTDRANYLVADLELRRPIARVIGEEGTDFYLDEEGYKVPLSEDFTANALLLRGKINEPLMPHDTLENATVSKMLPMLNFIDGDEFLSSQISEIVVDEDGELVLYPEVGDVLIYFGEPAEWQEKFMKMNLFYHQVLNEAGWDKYKSINLKYKDQVVAKKKR